MLRMGDDRYRLGVIAWAEGGLCYSFSQCIFYTYRAGINHIIVLSPGEFISEFVRRRFILLSRLVSE